MKQANEIDLELIRRSFDYDDQTGILIWRDRPHLPPANNAKTRGKPAGTLFTNRAGKRYIKLCVERRQMLAHRAIWTLLHGEIGPDMLIDHIDGDGLNNKAENLRVVTSAGNNTNVRLGSNNRSGYKGVRRAPTKAPCWQAYAHVRGKFVQIGLADTAEDAAVLRRQWDRDNGFHENHGSRRPL